MTDSSTNRRHYFSIDVEDFFQVSSFDPFVSRESWGDWESRVEKSTHEMLDMLDHRGVKSFCYVLGWVADQFPDLVRRIDQSGHVIGSHTYWHRLLYEQGPMAFDIDMGLASNALSKITGKPIKHFRAPSFSITKKNPWAIEKLLRHGIEHDSSIVPVRHDRYGIPDSPIDSYRVSAGEYAINEHPVSVLPKGPIRIPVGGGGYFRIFPWWFTRWALKQIETSGRSIHFYIHPWEIDPGQPRLDRLSRLSRFRHYRNLDRCKERLERLLDTFAFGNLTLPTPSGSYAIPTPAPA
jgi:polysaccharide deacetylase family protein (PEP-CTERM system associated)